MFLSIVFNSFKTAYKVVDLPLPVGPVTRIIPKGFCNICSSFFMSSFLIPRLSLFIRLESLERILITTFSPFTVGRIETLKSTAFPSIFVRILPSCGILFSAIFKFANILILVIKVFCDSLGILSIFCKLPSTLALTLTSFSKGST